MPFVSEAQERWAHTPSGRKALGSKLKEFDKASKGKKLPEKVKPARPLREADFREREKRNQK